MTIRLPDPKHERLKQVAKAREISVNFHCKPTLNLLSFAYVPFVTPVMLARGHRGGAARSAPFRPRRRADRLLPAEMPPSEVPQFGAGNALVIKRRVG